MLKPNIAVVFGGDSSEYIVSVKSGKNVFESIDTEVFQPWFVEMKGLNWNVIQDEEKIAEINRNDFSFELNGELIKIDFAYIIIHGTPGEDGILQGYFDLLRIPYSTCGVHSSALTFNKFYCSNFLRNFAIPMAKSVRLMKGDLIDEAQLEKELGLPVFVKPNAGGSSFGITKVKTVNELNEAVANAWQESDEALVEEFVEGAEFTCGLVKLKDKELIFPVTEVLPKNEFFDFEAKYVEGKTDEITPARISAELTKRVQDLSSQIYDLCNCKGIVRVDFILKNGEFYFLEVNTTPGMTATSFIPQQIEAMGMNLREMLSLIINDNIS